MKRYVFIILGLMLYMSAANSQEKQELYMNNRAPLLTKPYMELPLGAVKPEGWLKDQPQIKKTGFIGNPHALRWSEK